MVVNFVKMERVLCDYCGSWNYEFATTFPERKNVCVFCFLALDIHEMNYEKCLKEFDKIKHYIPEKRIIDRAFEELTENNYMSKEEADEAIEEWDERWDKEYFKEWDKAKKYMSKEEADEAIDRAFEELAENYRLNKDSLWD